MSGIILKGSIIYNSLLSEITWFFNSSSKISTLTNIFPVWEPFINIISLWCPSLSIFSLFSPISTFPWSINFINWALLCPFNIFQLNFHPSKEEKILPLSSCANTCNSKISPTLIVSKFFSIEIFDTSAKPILHLKYSFVFLSLAVT